METIEFHLASEIRNLGKKGQLSTTIEMSRHVYGGAYDWFSIPMIDAIHDTIDEWIDDDVPELRPYLKRGDATFFVQDVESKKIWSFDVTFQVSYESEIDEDSIEVCDETT